MCLVYSAMNIWHSNSWSPKQFVKSLFHNQLLFSQFKQFCSSLIFIIIFVYLDPRLSRLFRLVPTSPDNRGSIVLCYFNILGGWKRDMTELKFMWPVNTNSNSPKFILSPVLDAVVKNLSVTIQRNPRGRLFF